MASAVLYPPAIVATDANCADGAVAAGNLRVREVAADSEARDRLLASSSPNLLRWFYGGQMW